MFIIEDDTIKTLYYRENKIELIKFKGDDFYKFDNDFMNWWEEVSSYISGVTNVDVCVLSKEGTDIDIDKFLGNIKKYDSVSKSSWKKKEVEDIVGEYLKGRNIKIKHYKNKVIVKNSLVLGKIDSWNLYIYPEKDLFYNQVKTNAENKILEEGMIAKYYRDKTNRIKDIKN